MRPKNLSNPFRAAIPYLWDGISVRSNYVRANEKYICMALSEASSKHMCSKTAYIMATNHIKECLGNFNTVTSWLSIKHPKALKHFTDDQVQAYRLRWLNHLAVQWDNMEICK